jgi:two-component system chemotaxis sensor kinase CheA
VERGILAPDAELSEKELFALIFRQGLTTAASITSVSGRGVGMDVVKNAVEALRGSIEVSSSSGEGTSITLKLPLTLAIIDGLLVKLGAQHFIFPLAAVEECLEMSHELAENIHGRQFLNVRERVVPYIHLRDFFMIPGEPPPIEQVVITEVGGYLIGFVVDHVIGEHQTVIKALGRVYKNARGLSGATILGDGTLALIVDIPTLAYSAERRELNVTYN